MPSPHSTPPLKEVLPFLEVPPSLRRLGWDSVFFQTLRVLFAFSSAAEEGWAGHGYHVEIQSRVFNLSTVDIWGPVLCIVGCLTASLTSMH